MSLRDRFFTPRTARAIMSWRILVGIGVGIAMAAAGLPLGVAIAIGGGAYVATVGAAMPKGPERVNIDPFVLSEPWRKLVQDAQSSQRRLAETVDRASDGPLKETMADVVRQLEHGLGEAWAIARRGDDIDEAVRRLDRPRLRSRLEAARRRAADDPSTDHDATVASLERQLESADRLAGRSEETAATLRHTQTQLDELVARANEVQIGSVDTDAYRREVDDLVIRLEALHQAVEETRTG